MKKNTIPKKRHPKSPPRKKAPKSETSTQEPSPDEFAKNYANWREIAETLIGSEEGREAKDPPPSEASEAAELLKQCSPFPLLKRKTPPARALQAKPLEGEWPKSWSDDSRTLHNAVRFDTMEVKAWSIRFRDDLTRFLKWAEQGNSDAISLLHYAASLGTEALGKLAYTHPESLHFISKKMLNWPISIGRYEKVGKKNKELLRRLGMNEKGLLPYTPSDETPSAYYANHMISWLLGERERGVNLPDVTHDTWEIWFKVGWLAIMKATCGNPHKDELLGEIVKHVKVREKKGGKEKEIITEATFAAASTKIQAGGLGRKTRNRKVDEAKLKIRGLKKKLRQEFKTPVSHFIRGGWF